MKKLSKRTKMLISKGISTLGLNEDAYFFIEEELYMNEAQTVFNFIQWLVSNQKGYTVALADERFKEFLTSLK